jgi:hypothetical protein
MKYFKNIDGSYDIVNEHKVLFHYANGKIKLIGRVNEDWKPSGHKETILPDAVYLKAMEVTNKCL